MVTYNEFKLFRDRIKESTYVSHTIIPMSKKKRPLVKWKKVVKDDEFENKFPNSHAALKINGDLCIVDCDTRALFTRFKKIFSSLSVRTPHGGHIYLIVKGIPKTRKTENPVDVLSSGIVVIPPSPGYLVDVYTPIEKIHLKKFETMMNDEYKQLKWRLLNFSGMQYRIKIVSRSTIPRSLDFVEQEVIMKRIDEEISVGMRHHTILKWSRWGWKNAVPPGEMFRLMKFISIKHNHDGEYGLSEIHRNIQGTYEYMEELLEEQTGLSLHKSNGGD